MSRGLAIILFSGEAERLLPVGVLAQTGASLGIPVRIFVTGWATLYFAREKPEPRFSKTWEDMAPKLVEAMKNMGLPGWYEMLQEAKESGDVKVYVCSLMASLMGLKPEDLDPIVDGVVGATYFLSNIDGYEIMFI